MSRILRRFPGCDRRTTFWGLLLLTLLSSPNLLLAFGGGEKSVLTFPGLSFLILSTGLLLLLLGLFSRLWILFLLCLPFYLALPIELYYVSEYRFPSTVGVVASILESNRHEIWEYTNPLLMPAVLALVMVIVVWYFGVRALRAGTCSLTPTVRLSLVGLGCLIILGNVVKNSFKTEHDADATLDHTWRNIERTYPIGMVVRLWNVHMEYRLFQEIGRRVAGFRFDARLREVHDGQELDVVLVIGESLRRDSWSLGGYHRETTPRIGGEVGLVDYPNATAVATLTRTSVPLMISRATAADADRHLEEKTLLGLFSEAGYRTWWLSNQFKIGINATSISAHAAEADHVEYFNNADRGRTPFDDVLLKPLAQALALPGTSHRFVILHCMGSHWDYDYRYPEGFDYWQPSLRGMKAYEIGDPSIKTPMINAYDNSIRYTDHLLAEVIDLLKGTGRPGVLIFMPDHGENLFDDQRLLSGHGHDSAWELRVPLVFWTTDSYRSLYPETWGHLLAHRTAAVSADNLFYTVAELGQIDFTGTVPTLNLASVSFEPMPRRFLSTKGSVLKTDEVLRQDFSISR